MARRPGGMSKPAVVTRRPIAISRITFSSSSDEDSLELVPVARSASSGSGSSYSSDDGLPVISGQGWAPRDSPPPSPVTTTKPGEYVDAAPEPARSPAALSVVQAPAPVVPPPAPIATPPRRTDPASLEDQLATYQIAWTASRLPRRKSKIRMCQNEQLRFFAQRLTSRPGAPQWVVYDASVQRSASQWAARVFNKSRRFWLQIPGLGGDIVGFHVCDLNGQKSGPRGLHVAIPTALPYVAASEEVELSRVAKTGFGDPEKLRVFGSRPPVRTGDGKTVLRFGSVFVIASVKNFIVEDENGQIAFMIYKSSDATCTIKTRDPISPLMAFGIAIGIVTCGE